jgi:Sec-independent protein translocase protein TatA
MLAFFGFLGGYEFVLLLVLVLLLFSGRVPATARAMAQGLVEFKRALWPAASAEISNPIDPDRKPHA